jgi:hypothetical protein
MLSKPQLFFIGTRRSILRRIRFAHLLRMTLQHILEIASNKKPEKLSSYKILQHRIDFFGHCKKCQKKTHITQRKVRSL